MEILCSEMEFLCSKMEILQSDFAVKNCIDALNRPPRILHSENGNSVLRVGNSPRYHGKSFFSVIMRSSQNSVANSAIAYHANLEGRVKHILSHVLVKYLWPLSENNILSPRGLVNLSLFLMFPEAFLEFPQFFSRSL